MTKRILAFSAAALMTAMVSLQGQHQMRGQKMCPVMQKHMQNCKVCQGKMHETANATALIIPTEGNNVEGTIYFEKVDEGIRVSGTVTNLSPGKHGFHIHQLGDITAADGTSAKGHFNPTGADHGAPDDQTRHVGDLGNIVANNDGTAEFDFVDKHLRLNGLHSIIGRAVIIHKNADDLTSQPTGNAGPRVGMGVVGITNSTP